MTPNLRIGLDAHMVGGHETGNETYVRGLVDGFSSLGREFDLTVYHVGKAWRQEERHLHFHRLAVGSAALRLTAELPLRTIRDGLSVIHKTYSAPLLTRCPIVLTVHDICYVAHPEWFSDRDRLVLSTFVPWSIRRAARVITVSETCRAEILETYRVPEERVVCVPNGAGPAGEQLTDAEATAVLSGLGLKSERPYLLAVGNLQPRKNLLRLIATFRGLVAAGADIDLVIVGPQHYRSEQVLAAAREVGDRVKFTGYISDRQLAACYHDAHVFVFPSLYEGFGIPALEAMAHGIPVASSSGGALPEVCGDAAVYFDPRDVESMSSALNRALTDHRLRAELVERGRLRARHFSWARSAAATLNVYEQVSFGTNMPRDN